MIGVFGDEPLHRGSVSDARIGTDWLTIAPQSWLSLNLWSNLENQRRNFGYLFNARIRYNAVSRIVRNPHRLFRRLDVKDMAAVLVEEGGVPAVSPVG